MQARAVLISAAVALAAAPGAWAEEPRASGAPVAWPEGRSFTLKIHLDSPAPGAELHRLGRRDEKICAAPCDRVVEVLPEDEYYFSVPGAPDSSTFHFQPRDGLVDLSVKPGSTGARIAGVVALVLGALTTSVGSVIDFHDNQNSASGTRVGPGLAVEGVGLGVTVVGALAVLLNGTTWAVTRRLDAPPPAGHGMGQNDASQGDANQRGPRVTAWLDFDPGRHQVVLAGRF